MAAFLLSLLATVLAVASGAPASNSIPPFTPSNEPNMNGIYDLAQTPGSNTSKFPEFRNYPGGAAYFDVYSPLITQLYSQVFWKGLPPVDLPADVVKAYAGNTMAIVGFEVDQVIQTPSGDVSVPINVVYNHHFESTMVGGDAHFVKVHVAEHETPQDHGGHGAPNNNETWVVRSKTGGSVSKADSIGFGGANGGEFRKSFHGFPPGTAVLINSPHSFAVTPMQIDIWNRDAMAGPSEWNTTNNKFVPGPQPRNSLAPTEGPDAIYSGLLECPLTTRVRKVIDANYVVETSGSCGDLAIDTAAECYEAVKKLLPSNTSIITNEISNTSMPAGCAVQQALHGVSVTFNHVNSNGISCGETPSVVYGSTQSLVGLSLHLDTSTSTASFSIVGPADVWFGVGFNAQEMGDEPWTVIIDGTGAVSERKLVDQKPGTLLNPSVKVVSNTVSNGIRTVQMTRPLKGAGADYYTFNISATELPFINAVGSGPQFSYHKSKMPSSLLLLPEGSAACVCAGKPMPFGDGSCRGVLTYVPTNQSADTGSGTVNFNNRCAPEPASQLLTQHNPTCDVRTYTGGQLSCHHMWSLLDADQEIPWADKPLEYHFKYRFWYQPYTATPPSHKSITGGWGSNLGAGGGGLGAEFDVPKCEEGIMGCSKGEDGTWVHTVVGIQKPSTSGDIAVAHFHCHAPTCLSMSIANNDTGEVLCQSFPTYGGDNTVQRHASDTSKYQEAGFVAVPPCLWGSPEYGLTPPPNLNGVTLRIVKTSNATYGHHGEMAHGQFYYSH